MLCLSLKYLPFSTSLGIWTLRKLKYCKHGVMCYTLWRLNYFTFYIQHLYIIWINVWLSINPVRDKINSILKKLLLSFWQYYQTLNWNIKKIELYIRQLKLPPNMTILILGPRKTLWHFTDRYPWRDPKVVIKGKCER